MFWLLRGVMAVGLLTALMGCASMTSALLDAKEKVEVLVGAEGAGLYEVTATKDGKVIFKQSLRCDQGADGKLAGCHPQ